MTKTPELIFHRPDCRYRLFAEALARIDALEAALRFYSGAWSASGEDGECGSVPSFALITDKGQLATEVLNAPVLGVEGDWV